MSWRAGMALVVQGELQHPAEGAWTALLQTLHDAAPSGAITLALPGLTLQGCVVGGEVYAGRCWLRLVGGRGKLGAEIPGQHFRLATARVIAEHLLLAAGEQLDPASSADLDQILEHWHYFGGRCAEALAELCRVIGCAWWATPAGLIFLGTRTWPTAAPAGALVLDVRADVRRMGVALTDAALEPGTTYQGRQVLAVDHRLTPTTWRAQVRW